VTDALYTVGGWLAVGSLVLIVLFTVVYGVGSPWERSPAGRALFLSHLSLTVVIGLGVLVAVFGEDYPGRIYLRTGGFLFVFGAHLWMFVLLLIVQHRSRRGVEPDRL
jgi:hypothetical protein